MATRIAWVLNLDADLELAAFASGRRYAPTKGVREAVRTMAHVARASLLGLDDVVVDESASPLLARGFVGRAFCPTPRGLELLERGGAEPEPHPTIEVLCRVNSRAFASGLGPTLPSAAFVTDFATARAMLEATPALGDGATWRVKRAFGMAGRGQRVIRAAAPSEADLAFVRASLDEGGVQIEPNLTIEREYALHGMIASRADGGAVRLGRVVAQRCDARGAWLATEPLLEATEHEGEVRSRLAEEGARVAVALAAADYFGPFGIDAYTYRDRTGELQLQSRSEINARYSMGFGIGFRPAEEET